MSEEKTLYNEDIPRRHFLGGAASVVAGAVGAGVGVAVAEDLKALQDPHVTHQKVTFPSGSDTIDGYLARPKAEGRYPPVVIIPGIFGVTEYMRETAAQLAQNGFA